jgi:hypothetical protein
MDVSGKKPKGATLAKPKREDFDDDGEFFEVYRAHQAQPGAYFRANIWWWRPLWDMCLDLAPDVAGKVKFGHSNDGDGLDDDDSLMLAAILEAHVESGSMETYINARQAVLDALEDEECKICAGTGRRADPPETGAGIMPCNGCGGSVEENTGGTGKARPWSTKYPMSLDFVEKWITFLKNCGGFEIW